MSKWEVARRLQGKVDETVRGASVLAHAGPSAPRYRAMRQYWALVVRRGRVVHATMA